MREGGVAEEFPRQRLLLLALLRKLRQSSWRGPRDHGRLRELINFINLPENWTRQQSETRQRARETSKVS